MSNLGCTRIRNCIITLIVLLFCFNILFPSLAFISVIFCEKENIYLNIFLQDERWQVFLDPLLYWMYHSPVHPSNLWLVRVVLQKYQATSVWADNHRTMAGLFIVLNKTDNCTVCTFLGPGITPYGCCAVSHTRTSSFGVCTELCLVVVTQLFLFLFP